LDDLMRRLNQDFARRGRFYTFADLRAIIGQLAPPFDTNQFFRDYVQGTRELDYSTYLGYAGLLLATHTEELAVPGFSTARNADGQLQVDSIDTGSEAERAGLQEGDVLMMADGKVLPAGPHPTLPSWRPGQAVELQVTRGAETHVLKFTIGVKQQITMHIGEDPQAGPSQLRVREGWLKGITHSSPENR
jgi:predicted metalloprotease with PDZ domain